MTSVYLPPTCLLSHTFPSQETASLGHPLFMLFNHPAPRVAEAAALLMRSIAEGGAAAAEPMRVAALSEGAILHHLINAIGPQVRHLGAYLPAHEGGMWVSEPAGLRVLSTSNALTFPPK